MRKTASKAGTRIEARGPRTRVTATRVSTFFLTRQGKLRGPWLWTLDVRCGRRLQRLTTTGSVREVGREVRNLCRLLLTRKELRGAA